MSYRTYDDAQCEDPRDRQPDSVPPLPDCLRMMDCERCGARVRGPLEIRDIGGRWKSVCHYCVEDLDGTAGPDPDADRGIRDGELG